MFLKVIYPDLTLGKINSSIIEGMMKAGKIIALHCSEGWIEVRRKGEGVPYSGIDRRKTKPETFFAGF